MLNKYISCTLPEVVKSNSWLECNLLRFITRDLRVRGQILLGPIGFMERQYCVFCSSLKRAIYIPSFRPDLDWQFCMLINVFPHETNICINNWRIYRQFAKKKKKDVLSAWGLHCCRSVASLWPSDFLQMFIQSHLEASTGLTWRSF